MVNSDSRRVREIGRCIYCPINTNQDCSDELTEEHIAPEGMQGSYVLGHASCARHRNVTTYFEQRALQGPLGAVREYYHLYGRRHKKRPPRKRFVHFENPDGTVEAKEVGPMEYPYHLTLPVMAPAGILKGRDRNAGFPIPITVTTHTHDAARSLMSKLTAADHQHRPLYWYLDFGNFTKMLAKIAYGFAVYFLEGHHFEPIVLDLILSPRDDSTLGPYFVGGPYVDIATPQLPLPNERLYSTVLRVERIKSVHYVIARIQLFNRFNMPLYDVVVGRMTQIDFSSAIRAKSALTLMGSA